MTAPYRIVRPERRIASVSATRNEEVKEYLDRLMKMIPGEVVGLYLVGSGFIPKNDLITLVVWSCICLIAVIVVRIYGTMDPARNLPPDWIHACISAVAFIIWLYTIGGPFVAFHIYVS